MNQGTGALWEKPEKRDHRRWPRNNGRAVDFSWMVMPSLDEGRQPIDLARLEALGEKVWSGGGGPEVLRLVEQVNAGKPISLEALGQV